MIKDPPHCSQGLDVEYSVWCFDTRAAIEHATVNHKLFLHLLGRGVHLSLQEQRSWVTSRSGSVTWKLKRIVHI